VSPSTTDVFDASAPWCLSAQVSLRDESFGALAYHHVNRRLVFLKSPPLVTLVRHLADFPSAAAAIGATVPAAQYERYLRALTSLAQSEIIGGR